MTEFSWKRGVKHAAIPFLLVIAAGIALAMTLHVKDPEKLGEGTGQLAVFVAVVAFGASWGMQTGKRVLGAVLGVGVIVLIGGAVAAVVLGYKSVHPFSAGDRAALVETEHDGGKWLRHPTLDFELRHPGPAFRAAPELAAMMAAREPDSVFYAYADEAKTAVLFVGAQPGGFASRENVERAIDGIIHGMSKPGLSPTLVSREATEDAGSVHVTIGEAHFRARMLGVAWVTSYTLFVGVMSRSPDALEPVLASVRGPL